MSLAGYARSGSDCRGVRPARVQGAGPAHPRPARDVIRARGALGVHPGYALGRDYEAMDDVLLVALTEKAHPCRHRPPRRRPGGGVWLMELIYEKSQAGRRAGGSRATACRYPRFPRRSRARSRHASPSSPRTRIVRHFTNLATGTSVSDTGFYPLGSCTMKYNPRVNEHVARLRDSRASTRTRRTRAPRARSS